MTEITLGLPVFPGALRLSLPNSRVPVPIRLPLPNRGSPPLTMRASLEMERMTLSVIIYGHKPKTCTTNWDPDSTLCHCCLRNPALFSSSPGRPLYIYIYIYIYKQRYGSVLPQKFLRCGFGLQFLTLSQRKAPRWYGSFSKFWGKVFLRSALELIKILNRVCNCSWRVRVSLVSVRLYSIRIKFNSIPYANVAHVSLIMC